VDHGWRLCQTKEFAISFSSLFQPVGAINEHFKTVLQVPDKVLMLVDQQTVENGRKFSRARITRFENGLE
jgi:hypothetical protein